MITTLEPTLTVRSALIDALQADASLAAIVGDRIYSSKTPDPVTFPFIRIDGLTSTPFRTDCGSGGEVAGRINCFVKASATHLDPEEGCAAINSHVVRIVDAIEDIALEDGLLLGVFVATTQLIPDFAEADAFHGIVPFEALAL